MSPVELLDFLAKLGPLAREHGIESIELAEGATQHSADIPPPVLKLVRFHRQPSFAPSLGGPKKADDGPEKPRPSFAGRTPEDIRNAIPNWGED